MVSQVTCLADGLEFGHKLQANSVCPLHSSSKEEGALHATTFLVNNRVRAGSNSTKSQKPFFQTLKSLTRSGKLEEAVQLIESLPPNLRNTETYSIVLHACISHKSLEHGRRLYLELLAKDQHSQRLLKEATLKSKLITLFSVCGYLEEARSIFENTFNSETVHESVWVAMAIAYSRNGCLKEALLLYTDMLWHHVKPGNFAFSLALKACADLNEIDIGRGVHAQVIKSYEEPDQVVNNALLALYAECGCFNEVLQLFGKLPKRNVVSWNSLIASLIKQNQVFEALNLFRRMQREKMGFSWVTLTSILAVCARLTALHFGKEIHAQIVKSCIRADILLLNSLMDMYVKCGVVDCGRMLFNRMRNKDLTTWNTMLTGYAINGCMDEAMGLFNEMVSSGTRPDDVTFVALLSGCSHGGLTETGQAYFRKMEMDFGISPTLEHYACLVDILGRAGKLEEALEVVRNMPMKPGGSIWGSLLNSCRLHGEVSLGEVIAKRLFEIEPNNAGNYVILSNIYAKAGMWDSVNMVREMMQRRGIKKEVGCSWVKVKNKVETFVAGGGTEFRKSVQYKKMWFELAEAMETHGYVPDTSVVLHDIDEAMKSIWVCGHSERLATMYALINSGAGMPIRIAKNLRVCADCHSWIKVVSQVTGRTVVLRDTTRFHHFKDGECSCKDYW
ncbi:hypothetical protein K2173_002811 [Erythroxylum novogranatense]|uniref:DYW domain-containing protein n=1 Tax=Erythroxylum novogranatense TaxID=1862640 RepID=A0AAV8SQ40_9ROSI|nr:hypothetical protein K2173_002811 [Erythroxylum novogranatense]